MSKKNKRQKQKFPWLYLIPGGVFVVLAIFLFARQGGNGGTPAIVVDQQKINYGDVKFGVEKTFAIKVTNTGDGTLRFKEDPYVEVVEGC
jgi:hypothetical protein